MVAQFYKAGPASHQWRGACEVNADHTGYRQHYSWPVRSTNVGWALFQQNSLDALVAGNYWVPLIDPCLMLPEGV